MSLTEQLEAFATGFKEKAAVSDQNAMADAQRQLVEKKVSAHALSIGERFPDFVLPNAKNQEVTLSALLSARPFLVISFYRGGWCPYCNLELKALQERLLDFQAVGANLIAITPESPDHVVATREKNDLNFEVLTDHHSKLAEQVGIAFELPDVLKPVYAKFGIDVEKANGDYRLPIPATYIVNEKGEIIFSYVHIDYTKRIEPESLLKVLKNHE